MSKETRWVKTTYVDRHGREEHVFAREPEKESDVKQDGRCFFNPDNVPKRLLGNMEECCEECPWLSECKRDSKGGKE